MFAKSLPTYPTFGLDPASAAKTAVTFWTDAYRRSAEFGLWWTEKCLRTPTFYAAWMMTRTVGPTPAEATPAQAAKVIRIADVIEAAAAAAAAPVEVATVAFDNVQEQAASVAEEIAEIVEAAAETATPVLQAVAEAPPVPVEPQDLTRLVGIGPKLAVALADRGVSRYAQIAAWTQDDLAEIDKALDLKGRAVRDAWVAQAKRFAAEN